MHTREKKKPATSNQPHPQPQPQFTSMKIYIFLVRCILQNALQLPMMWQSVTVFELNMELMWSLILNPPHSIIYKRAASIPLQLQSDRLTQWNEHFTETLSAHNTSDFSVYVFGSFGFCLIYWLQNCFLFNSLSQFAIERRKKKALT